MNFQQRLNEALESGGYSDLPDEDEFVEDEPGFCDVCQEYQTWCELCDEFWCACNGPKPVDWGFEGERYDEGFGVISQCHCGTYYCEECAGELPNQCAKCAGKYKS